MDFDGLTDQEIADLIEEMERLLARRQSRAAVDRQVAEVLRAAREEGVTEAPEGDEWKQPVGAHDAYLAGDIVTFEGDQWEAAVDYCVWQPGVAGWRKLAGEDGTPAEYVQPSGSADAYQPGDLITWEGETYRCVIDNCVWSPTDHPAGWEKVTD